MTGGACSRDVTKASVKTASPAWSPFRRDDERDLVITEEDALLLKGDPLPLKILVKVDIEECLTNG